MVVAETEEIAQRVVDAADGSTLAGDAAFGEWTGEAGEEGFMSFYVAKAAAQYLDDAAGMGAMLGGVYATPTDQVPAEVQQMIDDFAGAAATVRFDDGAVEIEYAMSNYQQELTELMDGEEGAEMVADLPADTVAAMGFSLQEGWGQAMIDYVGKTLSAGDGSDIEDEIAQFEDETGLAIPEDIETLLGEGTTMSVGSGIDPDAITNGGPEEIPAGITVKGDADEIQAVLDKIGKLAGPEAAELMQVTEGDGTAVLALQDDYRGKLEAGGDLGSSDDYQAVIEDDAQAVVFVSFDADDDWLARVTQDMPEVSENLEPLSAFGASGWIDGDVVHGKLKLTTD
jgi:hypothetical protein